MAVMAAMPMGDLGRSNYNARGSISSVALPKQHPLEDIVKVESESMSLMRLSTQLPPPFVLTSP